MLIYTKYATTPNFDIGQQGEKVVWQTVLTLVETLVLLLQGEFQIKLILTWNWLRQWSDTTLYSLLVT